MPCASSSGDLDAELILELHDELDEVERVGVEIVLEGRLGRDLALVDTELLDENLLDLVEDFFARRQRASMVERCAAGRA